MRFLQLRTRTLLPSSALLSLTPPYAYPLCIVVRSPPGPHATGAHAVITLDAILGGQSRLLHARTLMRTHTAEKGVNVDAVPADIP